MKEETDSLSTFPTETIGAVPMQSPAQGTAVVKKKSLPLAIGLKLLLPGAGSMYVGRVMLGIGALLIVSLIVLGLGLLFVPNVARSQHDHGDRHVDPVQQE